ncbi:hypothetical protein LCGC14_1194920 [marine sediment metagenome]|uniref:PnuC protein n=1 Tax=marine sediment metagenome TaxID=412755 RepID=A0A0F9P144_9ZZZZ
MIDILGWIGNIGFILGAILIAKKNKNGLLCNIIANIPYVIIGILTNLSSLLCISIILIGINLIGYIRWGVK